MKKAEAVQQLVALRTELFDAPTAGERSELLTAIRQLRSDVIRLLSAATWREVDDEAQRRTPKREGVA